MPSEKTDEVIEALIADFQGYFGNGQFGSGQHLLRFFHPAANDVLERSPADGLLEHAQKMIRAQAGDERHRLQGKFLVQMRMDIIEHASQLPAGNAAFKCRHFVIDTAMPAQQM